MTQPDLVWSDRRPTEGGDYWLSVNPAKRKRRERPGVFSPPSGDWPSVLSVPVEHCAELNAYYVFGETARKNPIIAAAWAAAGASEGRTSTPENAAWAAAMSVKMTLKVNPTLDITTLLTD